MAEGLTMRGDGLIMRSSVEADVQHLLPILSEPRNAHIYKHGGEAQLRALMAAAVTQPRLGHAMRFTAVDDDGLIVGTAILAFNKRSFSVDIPEFGDEVLTVEPTIVVRFDRQHHGLGRRIFMALLPLIIEYGNEFPLVFARTHESNRRAEALLRTLGFREAGSERDVGENRSQTAGLARAAPIWNSWYRWVEEFTHDLD